MDVKDIKRLLDALASSEVREFTYETGEYKLSVKRGPSDAPAADARASSAPAAAAVPAAPASPAADAAAPVDDATEAASRWDEVTAPIVGTFYASPAPDAAAFVKVGDHVQPGAVLCIIEAMKLMNEIEADTAGVVREVLVGNEEPVEYGQVLFRIDPD